MASLLLMLLPLVLVLLRRQVSGWETGVPHLSAATHAGQVKHLGRVGLSSGVDEVKLFQHIKVNVKAQLRLWGGS